MRRNARVPDTLVQVTLPEMGESVTEGSIVEWRKRVGDFVAEGEPLVEVTTDKVDVEVPASVSGVIRQILAGEGVTVGVGAVLAEIDTSAAQNGAGVAGGNGAAPPADAPSPEPKIVVVTLPEMGESVTEGSIVEWQKHVGDRVQEGDPLVNVTTDKVDVEVPATAAGVVTKILAAEGAIVAVGAPLAEIDANAAPAATADVAKAPPAPAKAAPREPAKAAPASTTAAPASTTAEAPAPASARARRLARKLDIDVNRVRGSGPAGLILHQDVAAQGPALAAQPRATALASAPALPPVSANAHVSVLKGPAAALAGYMEQSLTIPTATSFRTLSVDELDARRKALNAAIKSAGRPEKISFTHLIAYAIVQAARELPFITHSFRRDEEGKPQRVEPGVHLGLAVDAQRKDGSRFLIVPVIRNAADLDFAQFRANYETLVERARENKLTADELQGASFTLTNPGGIGTSASVPRLMAGQGAILAAGAIGYPPGFSHASETALRSFGVGKIMQMTSTYDHRVIQGAQSGEFLRRVDELLQGADRFYERVAETLGVTVQAAPPAAFERQSPVRTGEQQTPPPSDEMLRAVAAGMAIVAAYRTHGHLAANLDPLGTPPIGDPSLEPSNWGLTPALQSAIPASVLRVKVPGNTLADVLPRLRETYSSTIAYEVEHISNTEQREWLRDVIESGKHRVVLSKEQQIDLLRRLTRVETFERYLRKTFLGQKTFSGEGLDVMVPMLEEILELLAHDGTSNAVLGMAHRGRLATIAHAVNMPYEEILAEFEAAHERGEVRGDDVTGDVKYHHGASGTYSCADGASIAVTLANNPSHLEAVDPVVEGTARALQTDHGSPLAVQNLKNAAAILIHGDAAFIGQGIVAEVLNLQSLPGYATGGTVHVIANNQVGFTTDPRDGRSTRYASDLAKGFDVPIIHVNADDVDACISAAHLAYEFRKQFGRDVVVDLIGYRRFGHNEQDEPAYTQPGMYERIKNHPSARELFANKLIAQGVLSKEAADELVAEATTRLQEAHRSVKGKHDIAGMLAKLAQNGRQSIALPKVSRDELIAWSDELITVAADFTVNKKLKTQLDRRAAAIHERGVLDWGMAEALAFASLISHGVPVRLTGQDTERGTFSHRHDVMHDPATGQAYTPLQHLRSAQASFEIYNSPLSEYACLGFEYGYSASVPNALVLWEAQFGDFNNGAQIIIDQFIVAGQAKWGQTARLTLLLPHGYEGMGPEHSSARLERFLQLAAEGNLRVANLSNATNYYHLLRQQATMPQPVPLVIMTPKSLLRQESAGARIDELANGKFAPVIDDPNVTDKSQVERIILCTGKIYHDLVSHELYGQLKHTAIVRIELLSPLPYTEINDVIATYPNVKKLVWVQEEPKNMGARAYVRRRLIERQRDRLEIDYVGRPYRASPSEGYPGAHAVEQERLLKEALRE
ncbi:MAG TPA: multifunctional oxoglutarate decarboxylase/oxoglutarate dehydrogenase thiamine pyrophosphate-binding subunit/dihydrolipoyllysine-residue succinyltransferase subunit [Candidatus Baltobacteraceae bacterium]|nr:multifunctional oxoglutarate decarboxylase/oxoglutarate dehydrogenase thiamine pyrophosphate-binding subunit/dihydrolipoyllysine-residue succinyltransferase subunit [Candidatus Baltobacteraceae bacterium]